MTDAADTPSRDVIAADLPCCRCGYNLRTLALDDRCPECGFPAGRSIFTIPERGAGGTAVLVAAWSRLLLVGVSIHWAPYIVGELILLNCLHRFWQGCVIDRADPLNRRLRSFLIATVLAIAVATLTVGLSRCAIFPKDFVVSMPWRPGTVFPKFWGYDHLIELDHPHSGCMLRLTQDTRGHTFATLLGPNGELLDRRELTPASKVTMRTPGAAPFTIQMRGNHSFAFVVGDRHGQRGIMLSSWPRLPPPPRGAALFASHHLLPTALSAALALVYLSPTFLYLVVCAGLADRTRNRRLQRGFSIVIGLFWLTVVAGVVGRMDSSRSDLWAQATAACLAAAVIGQIVAATKLSAALLQVPCSRSQVLRPSVSGARRDHNPALRKDP